MTPSSDGDPRQLAQRGRRAHDLEAAALDELVDLARHRDRERELAAPAVRSDQAQEEQQRLLDRDLVAALVDQVEALGGTVEDGAEIRADRRDELLRLPDQAAQLAARLLRLVRREGVRRDRLDAERPQDERQHERGRRVAVVDDDAELPRADRLDVERRQQVLRVALPGPRPDIPRCRSRTRPTAAARRARSASRSPSGARA